MNFATVDTATSTVIAREGDRDAIPASTADEAYVSITDEQYNTRNELVAVKHDDNWVISILQPRVLWLHVTLSGGDGDDPIGIINDGVSSMNMQATLRATDDPASPVIPVTGSWRITISDIIHATYDIIKVTMTSGVVSITYKTTKPPALCFIKAEDFDKVTAGGHTYTVKMPQDVHWKVYRSV